MRYQTLKRLCALVLLLFCLTANAFGETTVIIATGDWEPWVGEKIPHNGFIAHIIRDAFARQGYQVSLEYYPWARAYNNLINNKADASAFWYRSASREQLCLYSDDLIKEEQVFFYLKARPMKDWQTLADLKDYRIGVTNGYTYTDELWALGKEGVLQLDVAAGDELNFKKMFAGRIDIFPLTTAVGFHLLRKYFAPGMADQVDYHRKPLTTTTGHLLFSKKGPNSPKLLEAFNKGLKQLKTDGTYDQYKENLFEGGYSK